LQCSIVQRNKYTTWKDIVPGDARVR
jgi:hypothetical protein